MKVYVAGADPRFWQMGCTDYRLLIVGLWYSMQIMHKPYYVAT